MPKLQQHQILLRRNSLLKYILLMEPTLKKALKATAISPTPMMLLVFAHLLDITMKYTSTAKKKRQKKLLKKGQHTFIDFSNNIILDLQRKLVRQILIVYVCFMIFRLS